MSDFDPETHPDRLLWLRADEGAIGGGAVHFNGTTHSRLAAPTGGTHLTTGGQSPLFAAWVRVNALPAAANLADGGTHIAGRWSTNESHREWLLCLNSPTGANQFCFVGRGAEGSPARSALPGGIEVGRWYFVAAWLDQFNASARTLNLSVDGGPPVTVPYTGSPAWAVSETPFTIGASHGHAGHPSISVAHAVFVRSPVGGLGRCVGEILATLYNGGAGTDLTDVSHDTFRDWSIVEHWPLDEPSGVRRSRARRALSFNHDLTPSTPIGATAGPVMRPAAHDSVSSRWLDRVSGRAFDSEGAPIWRGHSSRMLAGSQASRFRHEGLVLSGRASWTASAALSPRLDRAFGLYGESDASGDGQYIEIRVDADGVPELAVKGAGGVESVARASDALHGLRAVSAATSESAVSTHTPAVPRARCRLVIGAGHPFAVADYVNVRGLGAPYDGYHLITGADPDAVTYVVDNAQPAGPASGGEVVGSGLVQLTASAAGYPDSGPSFASDAGSGVEAMRVVLTVRRDGGQVAFFRNGEPIGTAAIPPSLLGPASGVSWAFAPPSGRLAAPNGSVDHIVISDGALPDAEVVREASRLSVRVQRTSGVGPLAVQFDATRFAGVDRMAAHDYQYLWCFTRAGEPAAHDDSAPGWGGQAYARPTGFFVSQVFEAEGDYDVHLAVVAPRFDRQGQPQEQRCLFAGKVATIAVEPWPESANTLYVSSTHPNRSDNNVGTSPDAPMENLLTAITRAHRPFTRILLRRGDTFSFTSNTVLLSSLPGPTLLGGYGDPAAARPELRFTNPYDDAVIRSSGCRDLRVSGLALRVQAGARKGGYRSTGGNVGLLVHDIDMREIGGAISITPTDRAAVMDDIYIEDMTSDYLLFTPGVMDFCLTRCVMNVVPVHHFVRFQMAHRTQIAYCTRTDPHVIVTTWITIRHQAQFFTVTDSYGDHINVSLQSNWEHFTGPNWGIIERNRARQLSATGASRLAIRGNAFDIDHSHRGVGLSPVANLRGGSSEGHRIHGNRFVNGIVMNNAGSAEMVVADNHSFTPASALAPPAFGAIHAGPRAVVLAAHGHGQGGPGESWSLRWMRRAPGEAGFAPLGGQAAMAIVDLPAGPGTYAYRLDLVTPSGVEAAGQGVTLVEVPAGDPGAGYRLEAPTPSSGMVGQPSAPFRVSLRGGHLTDAPVVVTPSSTGPGLFEPTQVVLSAEAPSGEFRFRPAPASEGGGGVWQIATSNNAGLVDPPAVTFIASVLQEGPPGPSLPIEEPPAEPEQPEPEQPEQPEQPEPEQPEQPQQPEVPNPPAVPGQTAFQELSDVTPPSSNQGIKISAPALKLDPRRATSSPPNVPDQRPGAPDRSVGEGFRPISPRPDGRVQPLPSWGHSRKK